jgi:proline iminopeptidase
MADDLEALRRHLGLGKVGLIGSSYGGFLALTYALRYPDSVAILYALGTSPSKRFWDAAQPILEERGTPEQKAIAASLVDGGISTLSAYRHWWQTMFPLYFHEYDEEVGSEIVQRIVGNAATAREMFTNDMPAYDVEDRLREIEAPTLVLVGKHDWVTPVSESELIASGVKNAELIVYEHSGHFIFIEEHEKFLRDMREFTSKYAPPQPEPVRTIEAQP